jgi:hypothetical protein
MSSFANRPFDALREISGHWPNPVEATVGLGGTFNEAPRLPFQIGHSIVRAARLLIGAPAEFTGS